MTELDQSARLDTARSLAAFLNLSLAHIRRLTREHRIPAIPVGDRSVRFDRAEVLKALRKEEQARPLGQANSNRVGDVPKMRVPLSSTLRGAL